MFKSSSSLLGFLAAGITVGALMACGAQEEASQKAIGSSQAADANADKSSSGTDKAAGGKPADTDQGTDKDSDKTTDNDPTDQEPTNKDPDKDNPSKPGSVVMGLITEIGSFGRVYGWAADPNDFTKSVRVAFYLDGVAGVGTKIGETLADKDSADNNTPGAHAFIFDLPVSARDKKPHKLYAYAQLDGAAATTEQLLGTSGFNFTAYDFSTAGRQFYQSNVRGLLNACQGCHTVSYEQQFYALIAPAPNKAGTAGNNQLINKLAQINGTTHGGGQRCTNANTGICAQVQEWWRREFAAP